MIFLYLLMVIHIKSVQRENQYTVRNVPGDGNSLFNRSSLALHRNNSYVVFQRIDNKNQK